MRAYCSFLFSCLLSFCTYGQTVTETKAFMKEAYERNLRNLSRYNCEKELIQINLDANTNKNWDAVILKANECMRIQPSALALEMRGEAFAAKGDLTAALTDLTKSIQLARLDLDTVKQIIESAGGDLIFK